MSALPKLETPPPVEHRSLPPRPPVPRRWTHEEYLRIAELGFFEDQRVEFIDGEIVDMGREGGRHKYSTVALLRLLMSLLPRDFVVLPDKSLEMPDGSEPQPDIAVLPGGMAQLLAKGAIALPGLLVEVADTSHLRDRGPKLALYARAGIPEYWIVDLVARQVEVYREPLANPVEGGPCYGTVSVHREGTIAPLCYPAAAIAIADFLPPE